MELITRYVVREKNDKELIYRFTTFSSIFEETTIIEPNYLLMKSHLMKTFMFGMEKSPGSPSEERGLICDLNHIENHEYSKLANDSAYYGQGNLQHWLAQKHFLENDPSTIAVEVPVWDKDYSGCIDILMYDAENDRIIIYDFKPGAKKEKNVSGQLFKYAQLLSSCAAIPITKIDLFYGDGEDTFQVII
jgi:hypothetical protein